MIKRGKKYSLNQFTHNMSEVFIKVCSEQELTLNMQSYKESHKSLDPYACLLQLKVIHFFSFQIQDGLKRTIKAISEYMSVLKAVKLSICYNISI